VHDVEFVLRECALQAKEEAVITEAGIIHPLGASNDCIRGSTYFKELVPVV
jgi:hypothetical protein